MSNHLLCCKDSVRTLCNQNTDIIGGNSGDDTCMLCHTCFYAALCSNGVPCPRRTGNIMAVINAVATECADCGCDPCECDDDYCSECDCSPCECSDSYPCGCEDGCGCADCWNCHYDQDCECDDCVERGTDDRFSTWSDRFVWRQIFLNEGQLNDCYAILEAVHRTRDYNYATICDHDGNMLQPDHYATIMAGFREHWRNN